MRVYIAGPMSGLPDLNYPAFYQAAEDWRRAGWEVFNPAESFAGDKTRTYAEYVEADLAMLRRCDAIALLPGWENSKGAVWEREIAISMLGIHVLDATKPEPTKEKP